MRVGHDSSATRQPVEMGCFGERVSAKRADPVVLIVNGDQKNVWLPGGRFRRVGERAEQEGKEENEKSAGHRGWGLRASNDL